MIVQLVETALKRREDFAEIRYGLSLLLSIMDNSHLPALLELCHVSNRSFFFAKRKSKVFLIFPGYSGIENN